MSLSDRLQKSNTLVFLKTHLNLNIWICKKIWDFIDFVEGVLESQIVVYFKKTPWVAFISSTDGFLRHFLGEPDHLKKSFFWEYFVRGNQSLKAWIFKEIFWKTIGASKRGFFNKKFWETITASKREFFLRKLLNDNHSFEKLRVY